MRRRACLVAVCVVALAACNREQKRLAERLDVLQQRHATLSQRLAQHKNELRDAQHRLASLNAALTTVNTEVQTFLLDHRLAAECIRASRSTWGEGNTFSADIAPLTRITAAACSLALFSREFSNEVSLVAKKLEDADTRVKSLQAPIAAVQKTIDSTRAEAQHAQDRIDDVAAEIAVIRRQLSL